MPIIRLTCACCGEPAPALRQWWNRDTGFGCCARCFVTVSEKHGEEYALDCYGKPGIHHSISTEENPHVP